VPITAAIPPTFIVQTKDDLAHVEGSRAYSAALEAAGIPVRYELFETGGHGYGLRPSDDPVSKWPELCAEWLEEIL
jgi:acetyl esterase/lipase